MIRKKVILIADSDRTMLRELSCFLANRGHKVVTANKGPTVLRLVEKEKSPALAILKTGALGQDGVEVSHYLHEFSNMPVIILTAGDVEVVRIGPSMQMLGLHIGYLT